MPWERGLLLLESRVVAGMEWDRNDILKIEDAKGIGRHIMGLDYSHVNSARQIESRPIE
jgi:hypothetical protein